MRAEDVGWGANKLVLGKLSGRNAFRQRLKELGTELQSEEALNAAFARFKELADKKSEIFDEDLQMLVSDEAISHDLEHFKLLSMMAHSETGETPVAKVVLAEDGAERHAEAQGSGPVDATFKAIETIVSSGAELTLYSVNAVTSGTDSGQVTVRLRRAEAHRQRCRSRHRHRGGLGQGLHQRAEQLHSKLERLNPECDSRTPRRQPMLAQTRACRRGCATRRG